MQEEAFIERIRRAFAALPDNGFEGIGDDCAVLPINDSESLVFTTDTFSEDVHFLRNASSPYEVGKKSLAVNLSDVAAMGAQPVATLLALALPQNISEEWAEEFMRGYRNLSERYGVALIGGDTTRSAGGISITVTAIGRVETVNLKRRRDAKVGDIVMVTGVVGSSGAGLRDILAGNTASRYAEIHRNPIPHVEQGVWLGARREVRAMMDLSDGLLSDLRHIATESAVGAVVNLEHIPTETTIDDALVGGEDYKLLITVAPENAEQLKCDYNALFDEPLYEIGVIVEGEGVEWREGGRRVEPQCQSFAHF